MKEATLAYNKIQMSQNACVTVQETSSYTSSKTFLDVRSFYDKVLPIIPQPNVAIKIYV